MKTMSSNLVKKKSITAVACCLFALLSGPASADKAYFAGGCFWCMEKDFEALDGVTEVISGFTGGTAENPTYRGDHTGHYEAVEIIYDESIVSYQELLDHLWVNIDPFDSRGQFCDKGPSYLSAIFVASDKEKALAEKTKQKVIEQFPDEKVVTPIIALSEFFPLKGNELHHQDFYKKSPVRYKSYRWGCGRDKRLKQIWGAQATVD